jgi:hypothetical protein
MDPLAKSPSRMRSSGVIGEDTGTFFLGHSWGSYTAGASVSSSRMSAWTWIASSADAASWPQHAYFRIVL